MTRWRAAATTTMVAFVGGCGWALDDRDVPDAVANEFAGVDAGQFIDCTVDLDRVSRVGTAPDPDVSERTFELYVGATDTGGQLQVVRQLDEHGNPIGQLGIGGNCDPLPDEALTWSGGSASGLNDFHTGRVPSDAEAVVLHVAGQDVTAPVLDGSAYFVVISNRASWDSVAPPDSIDAIDGNGNVIETWAPPDAPRR